MLFLPFRRAALLRGFSLFCAVALGNHAHAAQVAPLPEPGAGIDAPLVPLPETEPSQPTPQAEVTPTPSPSPIPQKAPSAPLSLPTSNTVNPPPDDFYQTPAQLDEWLLGLSKARPKQVKTRVLGLSPGGNRIVALEVTPPGVSPWKLKRLVVLCRQHGNEPETTASGARFIREFLVSTDPKKRRIAQKTALLIVPIANPDGASLYRRRTDTNLDMNRDWGRQKTLEVWLMSRWITAWKPHLIVDVHQWLPKENQKPSMAEASGGKLARQTAQRMAKNNALRGYALSARSRWGLDTLSHRYWGQRFKIPSILLESQHRPGVPGAREKAINTSLTALWSAAETLVK